MENWKKRCTGKLRRWLKTKFGVKSERIVLKVSFHKTIHFGVLKEILAILIFNTSKKAPGRFEEPMAGYPGAPELRGPGSKLISKVISLQNLAVHSKL